MNSPDLLSAYANSRPSPAFIRAYVLFCLGYVFAFFDFFIVGYLLAVIGPSWHLTYGQSSAILLSAGIGAIIGSLCGGSLADAFGRKKVLAGSLLFSAIGSGTVAFLPDGAWLAFAALRLLVGIGLSSCVTSTTVMLVELTPLRYRTRLSGFPLTAASVGSLVASLSAATLMHDLGWRGLAVIGYASLALSLLVVLFVPESPLWHFSHGRLDKARSGFLRLSPSLDASLPVSATAIAMRAPSGRLTELMAFPVRTLLTFLTWTALSTTNFGVYLWGPTIVALMLHVPATVAAGYFIIVSIGAIVGRLVLSALPVWVTRRRLCAISGFCIAASLAGAGVFAQQSLFGLPLFIVFLVIGAMFFDGIWVVISPYIVEIFPTRLAARAIGIGQAGNGVGKIIGPLCLSLIAGSSHMVTTQATTDAILPAFLFLAACGLFFGAAFAFGMPDDSSGIQARRGKSEVENSGLFADEAVEPAAGVPATRRPVPARVPG